MERSEVEAVLDTLVEKLAAAEHDRGARGARPRSGAMSRAAAALIALLAVPARPAPTDPPASSAGAPQGSPLSGP